MRLALRHAWLNLWDKHMTNGRINKGNVTVVRFPTRAAWAPGILFFVYPFLSPTFSFSFSFLPSFTFSDVSYGPPSTCTRGARWRGYAFIDLLITKPCTISVIHVAAFMYCNYIPVEKAVDCFVACVAVDNYYVSCSVKDLYTTWDNLPSKTHLAQYFSMNLKRRMWMNGKFAAQNEAVW